MASKASKTSNETTTARAQRLANRSRSEAEIFYQAYRNILNRQLWSFRHVWFKYTTCSPPTSPNVKYPHLPETFDQRDENMALAVIFKHVYDYYASALYETDECNSDAQIFETYFYRLLTRHTNFDDLFIVCHGLEYFKIPASKLDLRREDDIEKHLLDLKTLFSFENSEKVAKFVLNNKI